MSYKDLVLGVLENDTKRVHAAIKNGKKLDGQIYYFERGHRYEYHGHHGFGPRRGRNGNLQPFEGAELSWIAASLGHSEVLSILLESGAPCSKIKDGMSALQIARHNNRAKCVALLDPERNEHGKALEAATSLATSLAPRITALEIAILGEQGSGGLLPRLAALENAVIGRSQTGSMTSRAEALEALI